MPAGDTIFARLRGATDAETTAIAGRLGVSGALTHDREVDAVRLSKEYRAAGGHSFANVFRDDHALTYREILLDVAPAAAKAAEWRSPRIKDTAKEEWLEEYVLWAATFAANPAREKLTDVERAEARDHAEAALDGRFEEASVLVGVVAGVVGGVVGGAVGGYVGAALATANPVLIAVASTAWVVNWAASPNMKKVLPATMVFIHIRKRLELEAVLKDADRSAA
ncbi:hypothetical protein [Sorangium sp. So ce1000]|uniref:hypothetical protein n=1 Tax=Sorangium sp. So ce1000 TaxID=3133325 RepID=UPI003F5E8CA7